MQRVEKSSLYERLGGVYSIATVVDDFIDRIMIDPRLNSNPLVDAAHHRVPPAGFKYLVTEMVCWLLVVRRSIRASRWRNLTGI
jgi:hemoglobin